MIAERVDDILLVDEPALEQAVALLLQIEKTVVEGAGAAGLAAVLRNPARFAGKTIGLALCGGNIDTRLLANVLLRDLARQGRLARLRITLQDRPGALFRVMRLFDEHNVNIIEIYHMPTRSSGWSKTCAPTDIRSSWSNSADFPLPSMRKKRGNAPFCTALAALLRRSGQSRAYFATFSWLRDFYRSEGVGIRFS